MGLRFARVEVLLGLTDSIEDVDEPTLGHGLDLLVARRAVEGDDLDFKQKWWWDSAAPKEVRQEGRHELAKDCVALANAGGGVLVVGVAEDGHGRASAPTPLAQAPKEEQVTQILAERVTPTLLGVHVRTFQHSGGNGNPAGHIALVLVPSSALAPHCVRRLKQPELLYPVRRSRTTEYLSETEVATRYRDRFQLGRTHAERVREVLGQGEEHLDRRPSQLWVAVAVLPADAVPERVSGEFVGRVTAADAALQPTTLHLALTRTGSGRHAAVKQGRVVVTDHLLREDSRAERLEVHVRDGAVFAAMSVQGQVADGRVLAADQVMVEVTLLAVLERAIAHVPRSGGAGDALIAARLLLPEMPEVGRAPRSSEDVPRRVNPDDFWLPVRVGWVSGWPAGETADDLLPTARVDDASPTEVETPLDSAADQAAGLVSAAAAVASGMLSADGVYDLAFLYHDGRVAARRFSVAGRDPRWVEQVITEWADGRGITTAAQPPDR